MKANAIINNFKPHVMVGVGGYASGPAMYVAAKKGIPVLIQEQNSFPGVTNKMFVKKAARFCVAYSGMEKFFPQEKIIITGNPVRANITGHQPDRKKSLSHFGLSTDKKTLLVIGGSLGSKTINESIRDNVSALIEKDVQVIWQTGKFYFSDMKAAVPQHPLLRVFDFIKEMDLAYDAADVIISRAGAIAISELCVVKKPVILVPSPNVAEDHQTKNALALAEKSAAWVVKDVDARLALVSKALELLGNSDEQKKLGISIGRLAKPDAAEKIAEEIFALAK